MGIENLRYVYVLVRKDLELKDIIVQSSHAAYESSQQFKNHADRTTIIILELKDKWHLKDATRYLRSNNIKYITYREQNLGLGETAIGTEPLTEEQRKIMRKFKLLNVDKII